MILLRYENFGEVWAIKFLRLLKVPSLQLPSQFFLFLAFAVSALASNWERLGKPFNPLLGETYELERPEFRAVCEQVRYVVD